MSSELVFQFGQERFQAGQGIGDLHILDNIFLVLPELIFGALQRISSFLDQVVDNPQMIQIVFGEQAISFFILLRFQDVKFFLPKPDEGGIYFE